jgi:uncharacterized membrane protein YgcG
LLHLTSPFFTLPHLASPYLTFLHLTLPFQESSRAAAFSKATAAAAAPQQQNAFALLLERHILPFARCRARRSVAILLAHSALKQYLRRVAAPLHLVFQYYAAATKSSGGGGGGGARAGVFQKEIDGNGDVGDSLHFGDYSFGGNGGGDGALCMSFHSFFHVFCGDFLGRPLPLSKV